MAMTPDDLAARRFDPTRGFISPAPTAPGAGAGPAAPSAGTGPVGAAERAAAEADLPTYFTPSVVTGTSPTPDKVVEPTKPGKTITGTFYSGSGKDRKKITVFSDGTTTSEDAPETGDGGDGETAEERADRLAREAAAAALAQQRTDAFSRLRALLSRVGLTELSGAVEGVITSGQVDLQDSNAILFALREQPAYQRRFAGNAARAKKGLPELDPGSYVQMEEQYRELMRNYGMPAGFYDQQDDFTKFIENDVSVSELNQRIQEGYRVVQDADVEVKRQMQELYGVDENGLAAYFLDPERAAPLLARQARAARIAARGREQAGLQLGAMSAEELAARGITPEEAQQAFARRAELGGLYQEMGGEQALTPEQKLGATFGYDVQAQQALEQRRARRVAEFQAGGGFARTTGATSGTVETGLGGPQ